MKNRTLLALSTLLPIAAFACSGSPAPQGGTPTPPASSSAPAKAPPPPPPASSSAAAPVPPPPPAPPTPVATWTGLSTPESVLWDEVGDRYLVSNINGKPLDKDGNGFISELSPDGTVKKLKLIEGTAKVKLDAPKGMGIVRTAGKKPTATLFVADIDRVRMFDLDTGASKGDVEIKGATFLNDVSVAPDGRVFVTDSGLKAGEKDFEPTGTDAVWVIEKGKAKPLAKSADLGRPNGVLFTDKGVLVNTFGGADVFRLDDKGAKQDVTKVPTGGLDGLVAGPGGSLLVSSWGGKAIYKGTLGGKFEEVLGQLSAPADIEFDKKRNRVLVPRFLDNKVEAYEVK